MIAILACEFAGVEEFALWIDPEGGIGTENIAELLRGFAVKRGDFR